MQKLSILQNCPKCGCSWRDASFVWIYTQADQKFVQDTIKQMNEDNAKAKSPLSEKDLSKKFPKCMPKQSIEAIVREKHKNTNQSRLMEAENGNLICPVCKTEFQQELFKDL